MQYDKTIGGNAKSFDKIKHGKPSEFIMYMPHILSGHSEAIQVISEK